MANIYEVALSIAEGVGGVTARNLLAYCGSAEEILKSTKGQLLKVPNVGEKIINALKEKSILSFAEKEILKAEKLHTHLLFYTDQNFPRRFKQIYDSPVLLYYKGNLELLNAQKTVAIVGTRKSTQYGKDFIEQFTKELEPHAPVVVSGLAYGIDVLAHKEAIQNDLPTIGIMANGLDSVYPATHKSIAEKMLEKGGLLSESAFGVKPDAPRFPARNRMIAALSDAIVVVEALKKGGAIITANLGNDYNKDVFAVPNGIGIIASEGCNALIKQHKAHLLESISDLEYTMGWQPGEQFLEAGGKIEIQDLKVSDTEKEIIAFLHQKPNAFMDDLAFQLHISLNQLSTLLLSLELSEIVEPIPGNRFRLKAQFQKKLVIQKR